MITPIKPVQSISDKRSNQQMQYKQSKSYSNNFAAVLASIRDTDKNASIRNNILV